ncbi:hypothetical protein AB0M22_36965 [Nocardia sp. NPDC051756]|uniref:hypothetical protein n=1 Tax=Nocardia sp. NPDC051756 TaxID=3154751 RepID=UPI0034285F82
MTARTETNEWVRAAALDNAEWCAAMCRSHGLTSAFDATAWASAQRTPPLYPDAVTLGPHTASDQLLSRIDRIAPGASIKDSFACLDLSAAGFHILFEAQWIYRPAELPPPASSRPWTLIDAPGALAEWASSWSQDPVLRKIFRPELLADDSVAVLGRGDGDRFTAGAVAHRSGNVVGITNLFYSGLEATDAWADCLSAVHQLWPGRSVVGYEQDEDLAAAIHHGGKPVGPLRVWLASA